MSLLSLSENNEKHVSIQNLVKKTCVEKPKSSDLRDLRDLLRQCPETWREGETLAEYVADTCLNRFYDNEPTLREIARLKIEAIKIDLDWQNSCPIERLLISAITLAYLRSLLMGLAFDRAMSGKHTPDIGLYWSRQLEIANKHYLRSIEALSKFRKMAKSTPSLRQDMATEEIM